MAKPIHRISLPSHHPAVADMNDDDHVIIHARPVPPPKPMKAGPNMQEMPSESLAAGERPMPLTRDFDVVKMERAPMAKGGSPKRPTKGSALEYMKERQTDEAYKGGTKPIMRNVT